MFLCTVFLFLFVLVCRPPTTARTHFYAFASQVHVRTCRNANKKKKRRKMNVGKRSFEWQDPGMAACVDGSQEMLSSKDKKWMTASLFSRFRKSSVSKRPIDNKKQTEILITEEDENTVLSSIFGSFVDENDSSRKGKSRTHSSERVTFSMDRPPDATMSRGENKVEDTTCWISTREVSDSATLRSPIQGVTDSSFNNTSALERRSQEGRGVFGSRGSGIDPEFNERGMSISLDRANLATPPSRTSSSSLRSVQSDSDAIQLLRSGGHERWADRDAVEDSFKEFAVFGRLEQRSTSSGERTTKETTTTTSSHLWDRSSKQAAAAMGEGRLGSWTNERFSAPLGECLGQERDDDIAATSGPFPSSSLAADGSLFFPSASRIRADILEEGESINSEAAARDCLPESWLNGSSKHTTHTHLALMPSSKSQVGAESASLKDIEQDSIESEAVTSYCLPESWLPWGVTAPPPPPPPQPQQLRLSMLRASMDASKEEGEWIGDDEDDKDRGDQPGVCLPSGFWAPI